jgi:hypothetical protein
VHNICSHTKQGSKLDPRDEKYVGIGYAPNKKGYKSYRLQTMKIHVSMDVSSIKNQPYFIKTHLQVIQIMSFKFILEELI